MIDGIVFFVGLVVLIAFDLVIVAGRTAYQESSYAGLLGLRDEMGNKVNPAIKRYHSYNRLLASLNLLALLVRFMLAGLVFGYTISQFPSMPGWAVLLIMVLAGFVLFLIEFSVISAILRDPERSAIRLSLAVSLMMTIASPLVALPLTLSKDRRFEEEAASAVTEDELKSLVDAGQEEGVIEQGERRMIYSIIELGDTLAREIMVPRIDMLALEVDTPLQEAVDAFLSSGHSRVPVYEDVIDNMLGLLYAKDLLRVWREGSELENLRPLLRPANYIPEAKKVNELLTEMQSQRIHMAIVVDEYGGIAGMVTLEDIIEEILGEIRDEYDQAEELPFSLQKNGDYVFLGRIDLDDFNEIMGSNLPKEEADTLGGYIYSKLGHVPEVGETVEDGNLVLAIDQVHAHRIRKVRARWTVSEEQDVKEKRHADG